MIAANLRASAWKYSAMAASALAVAAVIACFWYRGTSADLRTRADAAARRAETAEGALANAKAVIKIERGKASDLAKIGEQYEKDKVNAKATADRVAADLRTDVLRLRSHWQGCVATGELSAAASAARESDAAQQLREQGAADLVRLGAEADAKERRLQEVIRKDRQ